MSRTSAFLETAFSVDVDLQEISPPEFMIRIEFVEELEEGVISIVSNVIDVWINNAVVGGLLEIDVAQPFSDKYILSPFVVEIAVYDCVGPPELFDSLIASLAHLHRNYRPIVSVEIEL